MRTNSTCKCCTYYIFRSRYKLYGRRPAVIVQTITLGLGTALVIYWVWLTVVLGMLGPVGLSAVAGVDDLLDALGDGAGDPKVVAALQLFGHLALASSFLGVLTPVNM